ncbi:MAG TPA: ATP synthase F0 subunit B [Polyangia bacterium]|jgi:F-type H+-transporting ATPase subunit b|nr:ATP synthase F0 subunit B [Polyangia bacterium]
MNSALVFLLQAAPVSHEPQLIDLDQTVFIQLGIFLLLALVLWQFLWKPYLRVRGERVTRVEGYRQDAVKMDADASERLAKAEIALNAARREGAGERAKSRAEAQAREAAVLSAANAEAQKTLAAARAGLEATVATERAKLDAQTREVAATAARRILGREASP